MKKSALILSLVAAAIVLSACGGGGNSDTTATPTPAVATDGSCKIVDGVYQVTNAGCKTPDNVVCVGTTVQIVSPGVNISSGGILNLYGTKYKCAV